MPLSRSIQIVLRNGIREWRESSRILGLSFSTSSSCDSPSTPSASAGPTSIYLTTDEWMTSPGWERARSAAEKLVGYKPAYMSLRSLLSDEVNNIAVHLMRLVGSNHPIIQTAKQLTTTGHFLIQLKALVVLLIPQAAMGTKIDHEMTVKHRKLSEVAQMIFLSHIFHQGILDLTNNENKESKESSDLHFGNKVSILAGDTLLSNASRGLAILRIPRVVDYMSIAIGDFAQGCFIEPKSVEGWAEKAFLMHASLDGQACRSAVALLTPKSTPEMEESAFLFGKYFALARRARHELDSFMKGEKVKMDTRSLPILLAFNGEEAMLEKLSPTPAKLYGVAKERNAIELTKLKVTEYRDKAMESLATYPESDAREVLDNLLMNLLV